MPCLWINRILLFNFDDKIIVLFFRRGIGRNCLILFITLTILASACFGTFLASLLSVFDCVVWLKITIDVSLS